MNPGSLTYRHRRWAIPLMVSLVMSWCFVFCISVAQAMPVNATDHVSAATTASTSQPPCHSHATLPAPSVDIECPGCENQEPQAIDSSNQMPLCLAISWIQTFLNPIAEPNPAPHNITTTYPPPLRLHLINAVFLI